MLKLVISDSHFSGIEVIEGFKQFHVCSSVSNLAENVWRPRKYWETGDQESHTFYEEKPNPAAEKFRELK